MARRIKLWPVVVVVFLVGNVAGGVYAAMQGELIHACVHGLLTIPALYFAWRLVPPREARVELPLAGQPSGALTDSLTHLEQSLEAVAIELERVGEGQRVMTHLFHDDGTPRAASDVPAARREG